jgi:hypothetical protein
MMVQRRLWPWIETILGVLLVLAGIVVGAVPAAAQNAVGASTPGMINTVGSPTDIGAGQRLGKSVPQPQIVVATGVAANSVADRVVIGKLADLTPDALRPGERTLLPQLPKLSTDEAQWAQNERVLLQEMKSGNPIRDASVDEYGNLANNAGYLSRERGVLVREGWAYDPGTQLWSPGS